MAEHDSLLSAACHEPKHITDSVTGDNEKVITPSSSTSGTSSMEYLSFPLSASIADAGSSGSTYLPVPFDADIASIYASVDGMLTVSNTVLTFELAGTAVTGSTITFTAGAVAGTVESSTPTALNSVSAGSAIEIISDGGGTGSAKATVTFLLKRTG